MSVCTALKRSSSATRFSKSATRAARSASDLEAGCARVVGRGAGRPGPTGRLRNLARICRRGNNGKKRDEGNDGR